jgi:hypothetical protein
VGFKNGRETKRKENSRTNFTQLNDRNTGATRGGGQGNMTKAE